MRFQVRYSPVWYCGLALGELSGRLSGENTREYAGVRRVR
jgi:hypothetical protein